MKPETNYDNGSDIGNLIPDLIGIVLAGGESTRMGRDKSELQYHDKMQRQHMFEMLTVFCKKTFISCNAEQAKTIFDLPVIRDRFHKTGPMGGILSTFELFPDHAILTVPCDLPFLNAETIACLIENRNTSKIATCFFNAEGKHPEPLVTIWEPAAYTVLQKHFKEGCCSPYRVLADSPVEMVHAPNFLAFKNVNTADEYSEVMRVFDLSATNKPLS